MKRLLPVLLLAIISLTVVNMAWAFEENPLKLLPLPEKGDNVVYFEMSDMSLIEKIVKSKWFEELVTNAGKVSKKDLKNIEIAASLINKNVEKISCAVCFRKERIKTPIYFIMIKTRGNPLHIAKGLKLHLKRKKGSIYELVAEKGKRIYAYFSKNYALLSENEKALRRITDPLRTAVYLIWKTSIPRRLENLIPSHESCQIYFYGKISSKITPLEIEGRGIDQGTKFVFSMHTITPKEGLKPPRSGEKLLPISPPGKGKIIFMGAGFISGERIISMIKKELPVKAKSNLNNLYRALSTNEKELSKFLTGKLYLIAGGNAKILGINLTGMYAYYFSEMSEIELKNFIRKSINSIISRRAKGGFLKEEKRPGWDIFYSAIMPIDLIIAVKGRELIFGLISPEDLDFRMVLPPDIAEEIGAPSSPWAYLSLSEVRNLIPKLANLSKVFSAAKSSPEDIRKLSYLIPPWRGILLITKDPTHFQIQILY